MDSKKGATLAPPFLLNAPPSSHHWATDPYFFGGKTLSFPRPHSRKFSIPPLRSNYLSIYSILRSIAGLYIFFAKRGWDITSPPIPMAPHRDFLWGEEVRQGRGSPDPRWTSEICHHGRIYMGYFSQTVYPRCYDVRKSVNQEKKRGGWNPLGGTDPLGGELIWRIGEATVIAMWWYRVVYTVTAGQWVNGWTNE